MDIFSIHIIFPSACCSLYSRNSVLDYISIWFYFGTRFGSIVLGGRTGNIELTLLLFANTGVACYCILSLWLVSQAGYPVKRAVFQLLKYGSYSCPLLMIILLAKWRWGIHSVTVLLLSICCLIIYYLYVIIKDKKTHATCFRTLATPAWCHE